MVQDGIKITGEKFMSRLTDRSTILEIGGSVITEKSKGVFERAKHEESERIAKEVAEAKEVENLNLILIHGAGSFGCPHVERYDLKEKRDVEGVIGTHLVCKKPNILVCDQLLRQNLFPYPIHPFLSFRVAETLEFNLDLFTDAISEGFIPISHRDIMYNKKRGFLDVISGDDVVAKLAERLKDGFEIRIGMATDRGGVIYKGKVLKEIRDFELFGSLVSDSTDLTRKLDVTGGMARKMRSLLKVAGYRNNDIQRNQRRTHSKIS